MRRTTPTLSLYTGLTYEVLVGQLQQTCPETLVIVDNTSILLFDPAVGIMGQGILYYTHTRRETSNLLQESTVYYFRDDAHVYAIWGLERARHFCPVNGTITVVVNDEEIVTAPLPMTALMAKSYCVRTVPRDSSNGGNPSGKSN